MAEREAYRDAPSRGGAYLESYDNVSFWLALTCDKKGVGWFILYHLLIMEDYIVNMHRAYKAALDSLAEKRKRRRYHRPTYHSFEMAVQRLARAGFIEFAEREEESDSVQFANWPEPPLRRFYRLAREAALQISALQATNHHAVLTREPDGDRTGQRDGVGHRKMTPAGHPGWTPSDSGNGHPQDTTNGHVVNPMVNYKLKDMIRDMTSDRHYPPAYYRYRKEHPVVSVVLTKELKQLLDRERKTEKQSYADLVKEFIEKGCDILKARQEGYKLADEAGRERYKKARTVTIGVCPKCRKSITWDLDNSESMKLLIKAVNDAGYVHGSCG